MSEVTSTISAAKNGDFLNASWNGRKFSNTLVSNGTYFCRLKTNHKEYWSKLIIVNQIISNEYQIESLKIEHSFEINNSPLYPKN